MGIHFIDIIKRVVFDIDSEWKRNNDVFEFRLFEIPNLISSNLLGGQRILFIAPQRKLSAMARCALSIIAKLPQERIFLSKIDPADWQTISVGVSSVKESIKSDGLPIETLLKDNSIIESNIDTKNNRYEIIVVDSEYQNEFNEQIVNFATKMNLKFYYRNLLDPDRIVIRKEVQEIISKGNISEWLRDALLSSESYSNDLLMKEISFLARWIEAGKKY